MTPRRTNEEMLVACRRLWPDFRIEHRYEGTRTRVVAIATLDSGEVAEASMLDVDGRHLNYDWMLMMSLLSEYEPREIASWAGERVDMTKLTR